MFSGRVETCLDWLDHKLYINWNVYVGTDTKKLSTAVKVLRKYYNFKIRSK